MAEKKTSHAEDPLQFAGLIAHQLKSPIGAVGSMLKTITGEYVGHLNPRQKDLLNRADQRMQEAIETVNRILNIVKQERTGTEACDLVSLVQRVVHYYADDAASRGIHLAADIRVDAAWVRMASDPMTEALHALISNALKYTPRNGQIRVLVAAGEEEDAVRLSIADSGIGIPEDQRESVFQPFYRSRNAEEGSLSGLGLGLAFVKAIIDAGGGSVRADKSDLGGADFTVRLPRAEGRETDRTVPGAEGPRERVVIIGGTAAGPKVASKIIRMKPETEVTVIEKSEFLSYAGCGLPYYIAGVIKEQKELMATPLGAVRDPVFFQNMKNVTVMNRTEALDIDRPNKRVRVRRLEKDDEIWIGYDTLVLATGAKPIVPAIPGVALKNVYTLHGMRDAEGIRHDLAEGKARDVVIVGGGLIGVEMTEALVQRGCRVTIVEQRRQIMRLLDEEMAHLLEQHMEASGVRILTGVKVEGFEGDEWVRAVNTAEGPIPADLVVLGVGVQPAVELAEKAGLRIGVTGAVQVDQRMQTSDPDIYAAGDCVECVDLITHEPVYVPLGSTANKQGRVAAVNICGGQASFPGILGSTVCKVFDYCVARTGLTEWEARRAGFDPVAALAPSPDREHFMPGGRRYLMMKMVADRASRRLLGIQTVGPGQGDKRVDVAAAAIAGGMTVDQVAGLDLCYAPPYSPAMDNLITAANIICNKLDGAMESIAPAELREKLQHGDPVILLDVSTHTEFTEARLPGSINIPLGALRGRMNELDRERETVTFCTLSIRGYEAALLLKNAGFVDVRVLDGGTMMWPYDKVFGD